MIPICTDSSVLFSCSLERSEFQEVAYLLSAIIRRLFQLVSFTYIMLPRRMAPADDKVLAIPKFIVSFSLVHKRNEWNRMFDCICTYYKFQNNRIIQAPEARDPLKVSLNKSISY